MKQRRAVRLAELRDIDTWRRRCPSLNVTDVCVADGAARDGARIESLVGELVTDGYFRAEEVVDAPLARRLVEAIEAVRADGLPPVFAFVYDEVWGLLANLDDFFRAVLDDGYRVLPSFWAWYLDPAAQDSGWRPHRDRQKDTIDTDGRPRCMTVWVALADATPDNGCIYVLPAAHDPAYRHNFSSVRVDELRHVRALPAKAGTVLGWNHALLHWGSRANPKASGPRVSVAFELQRGDDEAYLAPLLDPLRLPSFEARLGLIGSQVLQYRHMHIISDELEWLAEELAELLP